MARMMMETMTMPMIISQGTQVFVGERIWLSVVDRLLPDVDT